MELIVKRVNLCRKGIKYLIQGIVLLILLIYLKSISSISLKSIKISNMIRIVGVMAIHNIMLDYYSPCVNNIWVNPNHPNDPNCKVCKIYQNNLNKDLSND